MLRCMTGSQPPQAMTTLNNASDKERLPLRGRVSSLIAGVGHSRDIYGCSRFAQRFDASMEVVHLKPGVDSVDGVRGMADKPHGMALWNASSRQTSYDGDARAVERKVRQPYRPKEPPPL